MTTNPTDDFATGTPGPPEGATDHSLERLAVLERLLDGEPPYPLGTMVRLLQDERDALRKTKEKKEEEAATEPPEVAANPYYTRVDFATDLTALAELLLQVDSSSDELGDTCTNSYRNPEGPEAWAVIERLMARVAELEMALEQIEPLVERVAGAMRKERFERTRRSKPLGDALAAIKAMKP